jgi:hypothetical protein
MCSLSWAVRGSLGAALALLAILTPTATAEPDHVGAMPNDHQI